MESLVTDRYAANQRALRNDSSWPSAPIDWSRFLTTCAIGFRPLVDIKAPGICNAPAEPSSPNARESRLHAADSAQYGVLLPQIAVIPLLAKRTLDFCST